MTDLHVRPFTISIPEAELQDLRDRLARTRWSETLPDTQWDYGTDRDWVKDMVAYWLETYDWRTHEAVLNTFPQFRATVDGQEIHFIHVKSPEPRALPLILTHGWPSTFSDFSAMIGPLTDPRNHGGESTDAFDVVIPSIPGFGFSSPLREPGWDSTRIAAAWDTLMKGLGYRDYVAHGGDAGSFITRRMGIAEPQGLRAIHVLEIFAFPTGVPGELEGMSADEENRMHFMAGFNDLAGYHRIQQTRPLTTDYGLTDSPVGQLAWIGDPFMGFGRFAPPEPKDLDAALTNVSIYWFTKTAGSSAQWYLEDAVSGAGAQERINRVPTGVVQLPYNMQSIRGIAERSNNITGWSTFDQGGHFAALDVPELLVADLRTFFGDFR